MRKIGFHASHELYAPGELLNLVGQAEKAGFNAGSCSDHFNPWSEDGQSGFAWSWLGAALERTNLDFGTVCAPGQRYHPAIIAQAAATLAQMYPGKFWVAFGTGQNVNEHITGDSWPVKEVRQQRLLECVNVIRRLWAGETVTQDALVKVHNAKLYTRAEVPPLIFGAAITDETAEWVGSWADGLLTVAKPPNDLRATVEAFKRGGGEGKPMRLQAAISFERSERAAEIAAYHNWGIGSLQVSELQDISSPAEFDRLVARHSVPEVAETLRVSADIDKHLQWILNDYELGFEAIYLHFVGKNIQQFISEFASRVIPKLV
jgi:probable non-F420 flavinoid oxidoreductase